MWRSWFYLQFEVKLRLQSLDNVGVKLNIVLEFLAETRLLVKEISLEFLSPVFLFGLPSSPMVELFFVFVVDVLVGCGMRKKI